MYFTQNLNCEAVVVKEEIRKRSTAVRNSALLLGTKDVEKEKHDKDSKRATRKGHISYQTTLCLVTAVSLYVVLRLCLYSLQFQIKAK